MANIDTLKYYESLVAAGNSAEGAKAHIYALNDSLYGLASKEDINRLDKDINKLECDVKEIRIDVRELRGDFRKHLFGIIGAIIVGVIIMIISTRSMLLKLI